MNKMFKKITLLLLIVGVSLTSFANCFGKFALTRKVYGFNEGLMEKKEPDLDSYSAKSL